jgi:hypothetical protein
MYLARVFTYLFRTFFERTLPNFIDPEKAQISSNEKVVFISFESLVGILQKYS